jgi:uncharacterized Zn finger protein
MAEPTPWSQRFLDALGALGMAEELRLGRRYARAGNVLHLSVSTSLVVGQVQGAGTQTHRVRIAVRAFEPAQWRLIERALAEQALFAAKLLAGELPADIDTVLARLGLRLFPAGARELSMDCDCPDWVVPCRHLAAACHVLAESFDTDPFRILAWRGRSRTALLEALRRNRSRATRTGPADRAPEPLPTDPARFFAGPATALPPAHRSPVALLDQLGPLTVADRDLSLSLRPSYEAMRRI